MSYIIDRRPNAKNKSAVNRQRFLERYRDHIKKAVSEAVTKRSITDLERGENISIPSRDISEPVFHHGQGGRREGVMPGNREFVQGDRLPRPKAGGGQGGGGQASDSGEGMDEFVFQITQDEFLDFMFEDLELPYLVKRRLAGMDAFQYLRGGIVNVGTPARINIIRSLRAAHARRISLGGAKKRRIRNLEEELEALMKLDPFKRDQKRVDEINAELERLKSRVARIPWIDEFDLKYNYNIKRPKPTTSAVMFCLMDVSGSMTQHTKDIAKRFFILLYLFLKRNYERIEVVFIRHHTSAREVDEEEFFYSRETGGTIVSSALKLMRDIMRERYPVSDWNIYAAQASDGDNWNDDSPLCSKLLMNDIMPFLQYYSYVEITPRDHQALWQEYEKVREAFPESFTMRQLVEVGDIYPVFRDLFARRAA